MECAALLATLSPVVDMYSIILICTLHLLISCINASPLFQPHNPSLSLLNTSSPIILDSHNSLDLSLLNITSPNTPNFHNPPLPNTGILRPIKRWNHNIPQTGIGGQRYLYTEFLTLEQGAYYVVAFAFELNTIIYDVELKNHGRRQLWGRRVYSPQEPSKGSTVFKMVWGEMVTIGFYQYTYGNLRGSLELWQVGP